METIIGFVAGYLVGTQEGKAGLERLKTSWRAIVSSPEVRKMALETAPGLSRRAGTALRKASTGRG